MPTRTARSVTIAGALSVALQAGALAEEPPPTISGTIRSQGSDPPMGRYYNGASFDDQPTTYLVDPVYQAHWVYQTGNPLSVDLDGDCVSNRDELRNGTDPLKADTDGDGHPDGIDAYPLDPGRWEPEPPTPGDTEPPLIFLTEPQGAVLVSSIP